MRVLIVTMQYPTGSGQSYLTTELAEAIHSEGHEVEVLHLDWTGSPKSLVEEFRTAAGVRVVRCSPKYISGLGRFARDSSKFILSGRHSAWVAARHFDLASFDVAFAWMPLVAVAPLVKRMESAGIARRILFIWDFFPDHHHEIGRIPGGLPLRIARAWEQRLLRHFTTIVCTLQANANYLRRRFRLGPEQRVLVTPIWGPTKPVEAVDRDSVRRRHGLPPNAPIAVFGGQLCQGRGFEQMLAAADAAMAAGSKLNFLFIGDGRLAPGIRDRAALQPNLHYRPALARAEYLELLGSCDVAMLATVPGVTSFSMPSKTIDYLRAGLPIVAAVEHGNEFIQILEEYGVGTAVPFGQSELFFREAQRLSNSGPIERAATLCLDEIFDVRHALAAVLKA